jgi:F-type H+-transporting ATPase subunit b
MPLMSSLIVFATEAGGEEGAGLRLVLPETAELVWGLIGFLLLLVVMVKKVFPAMNRMLEDRQAQIQGKLEEAERARTEAENTRRQYAEQLADARGEASGIVDDAKASAERLRGEIVARAEEEAAQILARAREDASAERGRLVQDLRGQVAVLSVELASKIVQKELDPAQHRALVDQYINELSGLN